MDRHRQNRRETKKASKRSIRKNTNNRSSCNRSSTGNRKRKAEKEVSTLAPSTQKRSRNGNDGHTPTEPTSATVFDVIVNEFSKLAKLKKPYYYQIKLESGKELFEEIGTFSKLFDLDEKNTFKVLEAAGIVTRDKNKKVNFKKEKFEALKDRINGFDFKVQYGRSRACLILLGGFDQQASADYQIKYKIKPPQVSFLISKVRESFKAHACIQSLLIVTAATSNRNSATSNEMLSTIAPASNQENSATSNKRTASNHNFASRPPLIQIESSSEDGNDMSTREKNKKRKNRKKMRETLVGGETIQMPNGYKGIHKNTINMWDTTKETVQNIKDASSKERSILEQKNQIIIGTFAGHFPQAPDTIVEQAFVMGGITLASQMKLLDVSSKNSIVEFDDLTSVCPSRATIHNCVIRTAANKLIVQYERLLKAKRKYIGCDKGAGILVKILFFWCVETKQVSQINLDFDKSGDDAKDGAKAVKHALTKYIFDTNVDIVLRHFIDGGLTDAGGGFTGKAMKKTLVKENLANSGIYIHILCTSHNDQTNLRVAVELVYGPGGLDKRNVPQLIHAFSDLQGTFSSKEEITPCMTAAWKFVKGQDTNPPSDFLALMQEPILTRWGTVGVACQYVFRYFEILLVFCSALCASRPKKSTFSLCASNFKSLASEPDIVSDLAFLAEFDELFFANHMEFNHATDEGIGEAGHVSHHHLVRYYIKEKELEEIKNELMAGTIQERPANAKYLRFWEKLSQVSDAGRREASLDRAREFINAYVRSLHKHNKQFTSADLIFLACFGEGKTAQIVSRFLLLTSSDEMAAGVDGLVHGFAIDDLEMYSKMHKRNIDLTSFGQFLVKRCKESAKEAVNTLNFKEVSGIVERISNNQDLWNGEGEQCEKDRNFFLENFSALPSTSEPVERAVKRARLCQRTGKGERNVSAYGIAGDGVTKKCSKELVVSTYTKKMAKKRKKQQAKAATDGRDPRSKKDYKEDLERGPGLTSNILNHSLLLLKKILEIQGKLGMLEYSRRYDHALEMLQSRDKQGTAIRQSKQAEDFVASLGKTYDPSAREKETGVHITPRMANEVPINKCKKDQNQKAMEEEVLARGLSTYAEVGSLGYEVMRKKIKADVLAKWITVNPGQVPPEKIRSHFKPESDALFTFQE
jgi:hypothetical protein